MCRLRLSPLRYYYGLQHEGVCEQMSLVSCYIYLNIFLFSISLYSNSISIYCSISLYIMFYR
eukprot:COSAG06_NODE_690_length_13054_cov_5.226476_2_plen_62_part_00